jgi:hypothetical protein
MAEKGDKGDSPLFDSMMTQKLLPMNVFAFYYSLNDEEPSELIFGWIDSSRYIGELKWYPVISKYFWSVRLTDVKVIIFQLIIYIVKWSVTKFMSK